MTPPPADVLTRPHRTIDLTDDALSAAAERLAHPDDLATLTAAVAVPADLAVLTSPVRGPVASPVAITTTTRVGSRRRRPPVARRALRLLSGLVLAVVALAAIGTAVAVVVYKASFAPVLSASMEPSFSPGDLLVTRALPVGQVAVGQAIVLPVPDAPGQRYVHRVVEVRSEDGKPVVRTQGDANAAPDAWQLRIDSPQVPLVVHAVPDAGHLALLTQGTALRIGLMVLVAGLALVGVKRALLD